MLLLQPPNVILEYLVSSLSGQPIDQPGRVDDDGDDDPYTNYRPFPPSSKEIGGDHFTALSLAPQRETVDIPDDEESRTILVKQITELLKDSSKVEGLGPNGERIRIKRGITTFIEVTISEDMGHHRFGAHQDLYHGRAIPRDVNSELITTFEIDEDGTRTDSYSSFNSTHSSIYGPQISRIQTPRPITIDLQKALENMHVIERGEPITRMRQILRDAVATLTEMIPFSDGHYDRLHRRMPPSKRTERSQEGLF